MASSVSSIDGLISGLQTSDIISQLMAIEKQPQNALKAKVQDSQSIISAYQAVNTSMQAVATAAGALNTTTGWGLMKATSSSTNVTATATTGALAGSLNFVVDRLATNSAMVSSGVATSTSSIIASGNLLVAKGGAPLGLAGVGGSAALALGTHTIAVTQASSAASRTGSTAVAASTTITAGVNDTITAEIDGQATTITLAAGTYTAKDLAAAIGTASAGKLTASYDNSSHMVLSTTSEGSAHSLKVTGGSALTALGLGTDAAAVTGSDGIITVDGTATTISDITPGGTATLTSGTGGTVTATFASGLRAGTMTGNNVSTGDGSLGAVVNAINSSGTGVNAAAVQTAPNQFRLQLRSTVTGSAGALSLDPAALSGMGTMQTLDAGTDAQITIGTGPAAYTVQSSSNTLTGVLPGVTLSLTKADPLTPVQVDVGADASGIADKIQALVDAANGAISGIQEKTKYDPAKKTAGILLGESTVITLVSKIQDAVANAVGASSLGSAGAAGLQLQQDGTLQFDKDKFTAAYAADPAAVSALFQRGGTTSNPKISFVSSTNGTREGTYAVNITQAASQASVTGSAVPGGTLSGNETIDLMVGSTTVSYAASAGATLADVAAGLTAAASSKNLGLVASVVGGAIQLSSVGYGSAATFQIKSTASGAGSTGLVSAAGSFESHTGTDVQGTINGQVATGIGQLLTSSATSTGGSAGITLNVTATAADVLASTNFGTFTYAPGVAQRLALVANYATDSANGALTTIIQGRNTDITTWNTQIAEWDDRLALRQTALQRQFSSLETSLGNLKNQSSWLASQLASLPSNG